MKAFSVQQPFAFEIMSGQKTIEVKSWDSLHRGDFLLCSSAKPAFSQEDMEEMEEEYGCSFLYGHALCVVRLADVRLMRRGDEEGALMDEIDPEAYSWVIEDVRLVVPFPVKGKKDAIFDVDDGLITMSPFQYDDSVMVKEGAVDKDFGLDLSGWCGRTSDVVLTEEGEPRIHVVWDSFSLKNLPIPVIETCVKDGFDWTGALMRFQEIEAAEERDSWDDVMDTIESIVEGHPEIFEEEE